jgi:hypothetical protein
VFITSEIRVRGYTGNSIAPLSKICVAIFCWRLEQFSASVFNQLQRKAFGIKRGAVASFGAKIRMSHDFADLRRRRISFLARQDFRQVNSYNGFGLRFQGVGRLRTAA